MGEKLFCRIQHQYLISIATRPWLIDFLRCAGTATLGGWCFKRGSLYTKINIEKQLQAHGKGLDFAFLLASQVILGLLFIRMLRGMKSALPQCTRSVYLK